MQSLTGKLTVENTAVFLFFSVVVPIVSALVSFEVLRYKFEKTFENKVIKPLKIDIINAIQPTANYNIIVNHEKNEILLKFIPCILKELKMKIECLSSGHAFEYNAKNYYRFVDFLYKLADKEIVSTSLVDPKVFWNSPDILLLINTSRKLINEGIKVKRYFYIRNDLDKANNLPAIVKNIGAGITVKIIDCTTKGFSKDYEVDFCLIDNEIATLSRMEEKVNVITGLDVYIGSDKNETKNIIELLMYLESISIDVTQFYGKSISELKRMV